MPDATLSRGHCRKCHKSIVFIPSATSGSLIPCDPQIVQVVTDDGKCVRGRVSHFATCPKASAFRRKPGKGRKVPPRLCSGCGKPCPPGKLTCGAEACENQDWRY